MASLCPSLCKRSVTCMYFVTKCLRNPLHVWHSCFLEIKYLVLFNTNHWKELCAVLCEFVQRAERVFVQSIPHICLVRNEFLRREVVVSRLKHVVTAEVLSGSTLYFTKSGLLEIPVDECKLEGYFIKAWRTESAKSQATFGVLSGVGLCAIG